METFTNGANGTATLFRQGSHVSIKVQHGANSLHTEQVYQPMPGTPTTIGVAAVAGPGATTLTIALPNAQAALAYSEGMIGQAAGPYNLRTNSCLTYCGNVLRAGGVDVPATTTELVRYLQGLRQER